MARHQQKIESYQLLSTDKAQQSSFEIIRKSNEAIVYTFIHKDKSFRSSAPIALYNDSDNIVYYLAEKPKINSINPQRDLEILRSKVPSGWRFPLACVSLMVCIAFLGAFLSPVFRERLEYWMYKRRSV